MPEIDDQQPRRADRRQPVNGIIQITDDYRVGRKAMCPCDIGNKACCIAVSGEGQERTVVVRQRGPGRLAQRRHLLAPPLPDVPWTPNVSAVFVSPSSS